MVLRMEADMLMLLLSCSRDDALVVFVEETEDTAETTPNTPPEVTVLELGEQPTTSGIIEPIIETLDAEDDPVTHHLTWYVNSAEVAHIGPTLSGEEWFEKGDNILLSVTPDDGIALGETVLSDPITVINTAPTVRIDPVDPEAGTHDLQCIIESPSQDADLDPITTTITWSRDGESWPGEGEIIAASQTAAGEVWTCTATPHDGEVSGLAGTDSVTITASPIPTECPEDNCALRFDGVDDYVEIPHHDDLTITEAGLTVEAWVYYDVLKGNCMTAVRKGTSASASFEYWLHKNWSPEDSLYWGSWPSYTVVDFDALSAGAWFHYAGVYDADSNEARIYLDGVERLTAALSSKVVAGKEAVRIGIDWDFGCAMDGVIDEVRISMGARYTEDFTPQAVFTPDADTMALYHFDAYTGNTAYDASGNLNDGTIYGAAWTTESPQ